MVPKRERWIDNAAGPLVRPYAITRGRTERQQQLDIITIVTAVEGESPARGLQPEHNRVRALCAEPHSVAEIAAALKLSLLITKVLVGDLIEKGYLTARKPDPAARTGQSNIALLQTVLDGIRNA